MVLYFIPFIVLLLAVPLFIRFIAPLFVVLLLAVPLFIRFIVLLFIRFIDFLPIAFLSIVFLSIVFLSIQSYFFCFFYYCFSILYPIIFYNRNTLTNIPIEFRYP
jgi:hypothetical protein